MNSPPCRGAPLISAFVGNEGEWERLDTTYFDTRYGALEKRGLSLRLREEGGRLIQAVKTAKKGSANIDREELECVVATREDFPRKTGDKTFDAAIEACAMSLIPIARTVSDRWTAMARYEGSEVEVAVDLGRYECLSADGVNIQAPLAELELELKRGKPRAVFDLGRFIARQSPMRICARSKLESALALGRGDAFGIVKPNYLGAEINEPAIDVLQRTLGAVAMRIASLQPALLEARQAEGVHQMRVALRRLRALEQVFRRELQSKELTDLALRARGFGRRLAVARDWDVFLDEALPAAFKSGYAPGGDNPLVSAAQSARARGWQVAVETVASPEFTAFLIDLMAAAALAKWRKGARRRAFAPSQEFAPRALERALKRTYARRSGSI